jgi:hypothetical protein
LAASHILGPSLFSVFSPNCDGRAGQPASASSTRGRDFDERDTENSARVAIVNETFGRRYSQAGKRSEGGPISLEIRDIKRPCHGVLPDPPIGVVSGIPPTTISGQALKEEIFDSSAAPDKGDIEPASRPYGPWQLAQHE